MGELQTARGLELQAALGSLPFSRCTETRCERISFYVPHRRGQKHFLF
jgi:hypothetical protein